MTQLQFSFSDLPAESLEDISQCAQLTELSLFECRVDRSAITHLSRLSRLRELTIAHSGVTDSDLAGLTDLTQLRELHLSAMKGHTELRFLMQLRNLESVGLFECQLDGDAIAPVLELPRLHSLDLGEVDLDDRALTHLHRLSQLRWLRVSGIPPEKFAALQRALPACEIESW